ncbi:hypothetical protein RSOLAG22IIIB_07112 [Rhizoctonia solani]|uniref:Uncharacterized protein n=1 Tax=Rhizoctonia solani TaxID=456999 RepID=A0A0K6GIZ9_9AGAM|nr:hypothetical protein RSOLAG22IIIB_07112 [Rhizoctonia solani]
MQNLSLSDMGKLHPSICVAPSYDHWPTSFNHHRPHVRLYESKDTNISNRSLEVHKTQRSKIQNHEATNLNISPPSFSLSATNFVDAQLISSDIRKHNHLPVTSCSGARTTGSPRTNTSVVDSSAAINAILYALVALIKRCEFPAKLDFLTTETPLLLNYNEMNRSFIDQPCKLNGLRTKLVGISTHDDEKLKDQQQVVGIAIERALQRMKKHQLALYKKFKELNDLHVILDNLLIALDNCVDQFEYPSELDFSNSEENTIIPTGKNKQFIAQPDKLDRFRDKLINIPVYDDEELVQKRRNISVAIGQYRQRLKRHQRQVYEKASVVLYRSRAV